MSARKARTEAAAAGAAPVDSEEKDVKIPVEAVDDTEANEAPAAEAAENQVEDSNKEATMTEDEMVEAAIRAGEEAADNDFKLKFEQAQKELADVRNELDAAAEAQKAAEDKAKDATERTARLQADWENFRRRTANERIAERERGDLVVTTHVEEHPLFKRKGADVTMEVPVSVYEAALGCTVDVPTPGGATVRLKVPAGTQTGKKFRFKEMGAPDVKHRGRTGALLVEIKVQVPTNLSDDERDAMAKLREADTRDYREKVNRYKATY